MVPTKTVETTTIGRDMSLIRRHGLHAEVQSPIQQSEVDGGRCGAREGAARRGGGRIDGVPR